MTQEVRVFEKIEGIILRFEVDSISDKRKETLQLLIGFIESKIDDNKDIWINFICTHNSLRSHLSQVWAQTMARYFGIKNVFCYSGGTELTSLFPMVAENLKKTGFKVRSLSNGNNPIYY